jgi:lipid II:glycine glycyltransferase (peptidoglycan interpeptide bridge formation enzyme)
MATLNSIEWEHFTSQYPDIHLLQSSAWGNLKANYGWRVERIVEGNLGAQVLFRTFFPGVTIAYIPKGPVGLRNTSQAGWENFLDEISRVCQHKNAFLLKIEPDAWELESFDETQLPVGTRLVEPIFDSTPAGLQPSQHSIQPPRTIVVSLDSTEEQLLSRMKQKTRYNIRLAQRSEVKITTTNNLKLFYEMIRETGVRDQFGFHHQAYYQNSYDLFQPLGQCELLLASFQDEPLAMLMVFSRGKRAWYLYGASRSVHRDKMPTYLLQWEAMRWAIQRGCKSYDLWGVPDENLETLEANFSNRSNGLWGVYRFKRGFGGALLRSAGPWDRIFNPILFRIYQFWLNRSAQGGGR